MDHIKTRSNLDLGSSGGGSLRTDSAGAWWASMSFSQRFNNPVFINNQEEIEKDWHNTFGDRKNEIVFIGQDMDHDQITNELNKCLATDKELTSKNWKKGYQDNWPIERAYALEN